MPSRPGCQIGTLRCVVWAAVRLSIPRSREGVTVTAGSSASSCAGLLLGLSGSAVLRVAFQGSSGGRATRLQYDFGMGRVKPETTRCSGVGGQSHRKMWLFGQFTLGAPSVHVRAAFVHVRRGVVHRRGGLSTPRAGCPQNGCSIVHDPAVCPSRSHPGRVVAAVSRHRMHRAASSAHSRASGVGHTMRPRVAASAGLHGLAPTGRLDDYRSRLRPCVPRPPDPCAPARAVVQYPPATG